MLNLILCLLVEYPAAVLYSTMDCGLTVDCRSGLAAQPVGLVFLMFVIEACDV